MRRAHYPIISKPGAIQIQNVLDFRVTCARYVQPDIATRMRDISRAFKIDCNMAAQPQNALGGALRDPVVLSTFRSDPLADARGLSASLRHPIDPNQELSDRILPQHQHRPIEEIPLGFTLAPCTLTTITGSASCCRKATVSGCICTCSRPLSSLPTNSTRPALPSAAASAISSSSLLLGPVEMPRVRF